MGSKTVFFGKRYVWMLFLALFFFLLFPIIYYSMCSIPFADDFSNASNMKENLVNAGRLTATLKTLDWQYNTMGGTWASSFIVNLFMHISEGLIWFRICILFSNLLLFVALLYLSYVIYSCYMNKLVMDVTALPVFSFFVWWLTNNYQNTEMYTWYTVQGEYILPVALICYGAASYIRYVRLDGKGRVPAFFCFCFASGCALNIIVLGVGVLFMITLEAVMRKKEVSFFNIVTVLFAVIGAIISAVAPGNFNRYGSEEYNITGAVLGTLASVLYRMRYLITKTPYLVMLIVLFILLYKKQTNANQIDHRAKHPVCMLIICFLAVFLVDYPYVLSRQIDGFREILFEDRAYFVQDFTIYLISIVLVVYFADYIKRVKPEWIIANRVSMISIFVGLVLSAVVIFINGFSQITSVYMWKQILTGRAHMYARYQEEIMDAIRGAEGDIVSIEYDVNVAPSKEKFIRGLQLSDVEGEWPWWRNCAVARFYDKEKVTLQYKY